MKKAGSLLRLPARIKCRHISRDRSYPSFSASVDEDGVSRYAASRDYVYIIPHTRAKSRGEGRKKYGDDTHPQARKDMVIFV